MDQQENDCVATWHEQPHKDFITSKSYEVNGSWFWYGGKILNGIFFCCRWDIN